MYFIISFCQNYFLQIKKNEMSFSLLQIIKHKNHLKHNRRNNKI